jgi:hypothetical protein
MSTQFHAFTILSPREKPPIPVRQEVGWASDLFSTIWGTVQLHVLASNGTSPVASSYTDCAIPACFEVKFITQNSQPPDGSGDPFSIKFNGYCRLFTQMDGIVGYRYYSQCNIALRVALRETFGP